MPPVHNYHLLILPIGIPEYIDKFQTESEKYLKAIYLAIYYLNLYNYSIFQNSLYISIRNGIIVISMMDCYLCIKITDHMYSVLPMDLRQQLKF